MKKFTIQDVRDYLITHDKNHECELLSKDYVNAGTKLDFKCNRCGRTFQRKFSDVKRNQHFYCPPCSRGSNLDIKDIQDFINKYDVHNDCELLSTQYQNYYTPLKFRCNRCGKEFERTAAQLKKKIFPCYDCCKKSQNKDKRLTIQDIQDFVDKYDIDKDCELISMVYINNSTPLLFKCNRCGKEFERTFATMQQKKAFKCFKCAHHIDPDYNASNYQSLLSYFRGKTYLWKKDFLLNHNQCDISGESTGEMDIHHLINFQTILNQASLNTEIPLIYKPDEFINYGYDINVLVKEFLKLHSQASAVLLKKEIHQSFHKQYGYKNNTPEQYYEFKQKYQKKGDIQ